jgi:class 3 adenylate cyclase/alpha-beta hydrolase superfamily lysophospholipase
MSLGEDVRYCASADGTTIGYIYSDVGREPLVFATHSLIPIENQVLHLTFGTLFEGMASTDRRFLYFDRRGIGYSQREVTGITQDVQLADFVAVLSHAGLSEFDLIGLGDGCAVAAAYAALHPQTVRRLALVQPIAKDEKSGGLSELIRTNWGLGRRAIVDATLGDLPMEDRRMRIDTLRRAVAPEVAARYVDMSFDWQPGPELASIVAPTLVVHAERAGHAFVDRARSLAAMIPNARLVVGKGQFREEVRAFLGFAEVAPADATSPIATEVARAVTTILFTDLVGDTEMMSRLGDERGRDVLREHERITREVLKANGGTEVKTMGDGFMASFGSVTKAVECAIALQRSFADHEGESLNVRVGLNAGEPIEEDGDLFGATVILASRIAAKAEGGEILVADTVRGLCSGKGFLFADRGEFVAKGFEEPVRVYEVSWRHG